MLDVSTENLAQLKEESGMVESGTLMRYIRIFSELSGQIRYASQKRVLVEIALIKLCRPQMETGLDSILDRVRVLEEKLEQGSFVPAGSAAVPRAGSRTGGGGDRGASRSAGRSGRSERDPYPVENDCGENGAPLKIYLQRRCAQI